MPKWDHEQALSNEQISIPGSRFTSARFSFHDGGRPRLRATEEDIELTTTWKTIKMTEDRKLLLCQLPGSRVLQEDYTKDEEYRFLNLAISWILLGLLAVLDTHFKKMYSGFNIYFDVSETFYRIVPCHGT